MFNPDGKTGKIKGWLTDKQSDGQKWGWETEQEIMYEKKEHTRRRMLPQAALNALGVANYVIMEQKGTGYYYQTWKILRVWNQNRFQSPTSQKCSFEIQCKRLKPTSAESHSCKIHLNLRKKKDGNKLRQFRIWETASNSAIITEDGILLSELFIKS